MRIVRWSRAVSDDSFTLTQSENRGSRAGRAGGVSREKNNQFSKFAGPGLTGFNNFWNIRSKHSLIKSSNSG